MPISTLQGAAGLSPQQLADFMLQEDQARRRAIAAGNMARAIEHNRELRRLADLLP
jgi:hypothetical protein